MISFVEIISATIAFLVSVAVVAFILVLRMRDDDRINKLHKRINDDRIANGLPPLSRKDLAL